jgi:hypothetical protein
MEWILVIDWEQGMLVGFEVAFHYELHRRESAFFLCPHFEGEVLPCPLQQTSRSLPADLPSSEYPWLLEE